MVFAARLALAPVDIYQDSPPAFDLHFGMWLNVAASKLSEADRANAVKGSAQAARKLTPVELLRAEQMARDWKPSTPGGE